MSFLNARALFVAPILVTACSLGGGEEVARSEQDQRIKPEGDETLGTVIVRRPPVATRSVALRLDGQIIDFDVAQRMPEGAHALELVYGGVGDWQNVPFAERARRVVESVLVKKGTTTEIALAALRVSVTKPAWVGTGDINLHPTYDERVTVVVENPHAAPEKEGMPAYCPGDTPTDAVVVSCKTDTVLAKPSKSYGSPEQCVSENPGCTGHDGVALVCKPTASACWAQEEYQLFDGSGVSGAFSGAPVPVFPNRVRVWTFEGAWRAEDVPAGGLTTIAITSPPGALLGLDIRPPLRELPDGNVQRVWIGSPGASVSRTVGMVTEHVDVATETDTQVLRVIHRGVTLDVTLSAAAVTKLDLQRLDVDDVIVTREDGTKTTVRGTYLVYTSPDGITVGPALDGAVWTGQGIDVLPGRYVVVVSYPTAEGQKTKSYHVDLRN